MKNVFFSPKSVAASLQFMWAGFHCHTQGLSAGFALIAVNMVRSPCVDGVCRKVYQSALFFASHHNVCNCFQDVCDR